MRPRALYSVPGGCNFLAGDSRRCLRCESAAHRVALPHSCARQENGKSHFVDIAGPVAFGVVHGVDLNDTRAEPRIRNGFRGVAASADRHHHAVLTVFDAAHGHAGEGRSYHLVYKVGAAAAQVVSEVADDGFFTRSFLDFIAQILANVGFLPMPERVRLPGFADMITLPFGAFRQNHKRVIAWSLLFVSEYEINQLFQIESVFGNAAARGGDVCGVECRISGIPAEDAEDAD